MHLRPGAIALVAAGGTVGTLLRAGTTKIITDGPAGPSAAPVVTCVINVVGSFALGLLLAALARGGPDAGWRRRLRLLVGTGVLGGFTTYSSFAVDVTRIGGGGAVGTAVLLALASLVLGLGAAALGLVLGDRGRAAT